jgi:formate hydrogenlyase transcriptional activator
LELENEYLKSEVRENFGGLLGRSAALQKILRQIELVTPTDANVLILGESGTGKELIARAIHERGKAQRTGTRQG